LRGKVKQEIKEREKNWFRVNPEVVNNLITKFQKWV
jgi:ribosomal protein L23